MSASTSSVNDFNELSERSWKGAYESSRESSCMDGRKLVNWKNARGVLIGASTLAIIACKVYNLVQGKFLVDELDVASNLALGFQARLLLPHVLPERFQTPFMNFMQRYSLELNMILTQFYRNMQGHIPLTALNQVTFTLFDSLLSFLTADSLHTAFTLTLGDLDYNYLHSSKPLPLLSGDSQNGTHFLVYSAWKIAACVGLLIPNDKYHLFQASGVFFGSNFLGGLFSFLSRKIRSKDLKQLTPGQKPSLLTRALNNFAAFNQVTHPIVIAFSNALLPKLLPTYNLDIGIAGLLYGMNSQEQKYHFQQSFVKHEEEDFSEASEAEENLPTDWQENQILRDEEGKIREREKEDAESIPSRDNSYDDEWRVDRQLSEYRIGSINDLQSRVREDAPLLSSTSAINSSSRQRMESTTVKIKNYVKLRWKEVILNGLFMALTIGFATWGVSDNATDRDIISGMCIIGGMFLAYAYALMVSSQFDPVNASPSNRNSRQPSSIVKSCSQLLKATKNTIYFKTIIDPYGFVFAYLLLSSLGIKFDDTDFQNSKTVEYVLQNLALYAYGANWGVHRAKADRLNRPARALTPIMLLNMLAVTAYLQATGHYDTRDT